MREVVYRCDRCGERLGHKPIEHRLVVALTPVSRVAQEMCNRCSAALAELHRVFLRDAPEKAEEGER